MGFDVLVDDLGIVWGSSVKFEDYDFVCVKVVNSRSEGLEDVSLLRHARRWACFRALETCVVSAHHHCGGAGGAWGIVVMTHGSATATAETSDDNDGGDDDDEYDDDDEEQKNDKRRIIVIVLLLLLIIVMRHMAHSDSVLCCLHLLT